MAEEQQVDEMVAPSAEELKDFVVGGQSAKKGKKRRSQDEGAGLTMNSLMDIMTIILCFLLQSYGDNPITVKSSPDLQISESTTEVDVVDTMVITVTRKAIIVGDHLVVAVKDGVVDKSQKRGGENSLYIQPLFDQLTEEVSRHKQMATLRKKDWEGVATIVADRTVPYRLVTEVMYTAGQAQVANFKFAVIKYGRADTIKKIQGG